MKTLPLLVIVILAVAVSGLVTPTPAATTSFMPTEGYSWNHSTIEVQIAPTPSQSWFKPSFTNAVGAGIRRWTDSMAVFIDAYGFDYLHQLKFNIYVTGTNQSSSPDVEISFVRFNQTYVGVTTWRSTTTGFFPKPVTTELATYDSSNTTQLADVDMENIAMHEFGHALGLGHPPVILTDDNIFELMYKSYGYPIGRPTNAREEPSTLDVYSLAKIYSWLPNNPPLFGPSAQNIFLPSGMPYTALIPYPDQISSLQNFIQSQNQKIIILAVLAAIFFATTIILTVLLSRKKAPPLQPQPFPPTEPAPLLPPEQSGDTA